MTVTTCDWDDPVWLSLRQEQYDKRMTADGASALDPASESMFGLHSLVVAEIDNLPKSEGGRQ